MPKPPFLFDLHVHTAFSDGQVDFHTLLKALIRNNVRYVGFADHIFPGALYPHPSKMKPFSGLQTSYSAEKLHYRRKALKIINKLYPQITILNGGEIDVLPHGGLTLPRGITASFFKEPGSYLMVSKHHTLPKELSILWKKRPNLERWMWQHNPRLRMNAYLWEKGLYAAFERYSPDIFAHPTEHIPRYFPENIIRRFLLYCKKYNVAFELNPGNRNYMKWIFKYGAKYHVKFSIGSDFHGFKKSNDSELQMGLAYFEKAQDFGLELIDPRDFLRTNS